MSPEKTKQVETRIDEITQRIAQQFKPEKIILFGSHAWGEPNDDSDIDLYVICKTDDTFQTARKIDNELWQRTFPLDIIVNSPELVKRRLAEEDPFVQDVMQKGKVLYSNE